MKRSFLGAIMLLIIPNVAQSQPLPADQWNDETVLWLARAMVSEADWSSLDHAAIAWTLKRQWESRHEKDETWNFVDQLRAYCAGMRGDPRSARSVWIRSLELEADPGKPPERWPHDVAWRVYAPLWGRTLQLARAWGEGRVRDPCRGLAWHWGGPMDQSSNEPVDCGMTANIFYKAHARAKPRRRVP